MKQFSFQYRDSQQLGKELERFRKESCPCSLPKMIFQIYTEVLDSSILGEVCKVIEKVFPDVPYMGCSTSGNIIDCAVSSKITVVCTVFESPSSIVLLRHYDLTKNTTEEITAMIMKETRENLQIKAVEMYFTIPESSYTAFCDGLKDMNPQVQIFGGVSCSDDITSADCLVFTKEGGFSSKSIVIIFYGGEEFYVSSIKITGWKPLKRTFHVTKSEGSTLRELDGVAAYDVYRKYLNIDNDENFFYNTLEFPLFYEHNGTTILRVPVSSNADGSINVSSDIEEGSVVCLSYGDPRTVVESIKKDSGEIREFQPQLLHIFSCAARKAFWNTNEPTYELSPFLNMASSAGFFSHGEFIRTNGFLNQHNVTLVIAAMREGEKSEIVPIVSLEEEKELSLSKIPLVSRLATFIGESSRELEEFNSRLEAANEKLKAAAIIDGLTGLYNRKEIQTRIERRLADVKKESFSLIMLDIDNFKMVNDTYGHQEGDTVIMALADILRNENIRSSSNFSAGRWGGEEFMLLLPDTKLPAAALIGELIRKYFSDTKFTAVRSQTISVGVTQAREDDTIDSLCTRVDTALYKAKKGGKNRVMTE